MPCHHTGIDDNPNFRYTWSQNDMPDHKQCILHWFLILTSM
jgi:hypothetical protein